MNGRAILLWQGRAAPSSFVPEENSTVILTLFTITQGHACPCSFWPFFPLFASFFLPHLCIATEAPTNLPIYTLQILEERPEDETWICPAYATKSEPFRSGAGEASLFFSWMCCVTCTIDVPYPRRRSHLRKVHGSHLLPL